FPMPWHPKENPAVTGFWNHQGVDTIQELLVNDNMRTLTWANQVLMRRGVHLQDIIHKNARRIDNRLSFNMIGFASFSISYADTIDFSLLILMDFYRFHIVQYGRTMFKSGLAQVYGQPSIVELAIIIQDATFKVFGFDVRQFLDDFLFREAFRIPDSETACKPIIELQAN